MNKTKDESESLRVKHRKETCYKRCNRKLKRDSSKEKIGAETERKTQAERNNGLNEKFNIVFKQKHVIT